MTKRLRFIVVGLPALAAVLCGGCGGGGTSMSTAALSSQNAGRGTVAISLRFSAKPAPRAVFRRPHARGVFTPPTLPPYAGNIPYGARSVRVSVSDPTTGTALAPPRVVFAPNTATGVDPLVTIQYAALPVGSVKVDVEAHPNSDGSGNTVAAGSTTGTVRALQTTSVTVPLVLTIKRIVVSPDALNLGSDGDTATISAVAQDAAGQPLDVPLMYLSVDPDIADVQAQSGDPTMANVVTGVPRGTTQLVAYEPNSGVFAVVDVDTRGT
jgi:hypothetical protein